MRRTYRGGSLVEALFAAGLLAAAGVALVQALAVASTAGTQFAVAAQARRLLQQDFEQVRSGRGIPGGGARGPFTVSIATGGAAYTGLVSAAGAPSCSGCVGGYVTTGVSGLTVVYIVITATVSGAPVARGTTVTPP